MTRFGHTRIPYVLCFAEIQKQTSPRKRPALDPSSRGFVVLPTPQYIYGDIPDRGFLTVTRYRRRGGYPDWGRHRLGPSDDARGDG